MGTPRFTPEFKEEAVRQITERGYSVAEVSDRLGVSAHSLYKWLRPSSLITANSMPGFTGSQKRDPETTGAAKRTEEERDILKRPRGTFCREPD